MIITFVKLFSRYACEAEHNESHLRWNKASRFHQGRRNSGRAGGRV